MTDYLLSSAWKSPLGAGRIRPKLNEKKEIYLISNKIVRTMHITQSAIGDKRGLWTTVLAAAILLGVDE